MSQLLHQHLPQLNGQLGLYNLLQLGNAVHSNVSSSIQYSFAAKAAEFKSLQSNRV